MELRRGEAAPFGGVLLSRAALARLIVAPEARARVLKAEFAAKTGEARARARAELDLARAGREAAEARAAAIERDLTRRGKVYEDAIRATADPPWYKSRYLAFVSGVTTGVVLFICSVAVAK